MVCSTNQETELGAEQVPHLRRILRCSNQQYQASLSFDKATAMRKEEMGLAKEEQARAPKTSKHDAQLALKLHAELCNMVCYKIPRSDEAPPKVVVHLHNAFNNGTLSAIDLEIKKCVL